MNEELEPWVRGLGARTSDVAQCAGEEALRPPQAGKQKKHLTAASLPPETIRLEINGRPFFVVLRDERVYMAYVTGRKHVAIKGVKARGAVATALELARLLHLEGSAWPDRNVALACNWPNVVAPPLALVALKKKTVPRLTAPSATRSTHKPPQVSLQLGGAPRAEVAKHMLPGDAVEVKAADRTFYVLLEQNMAFMHVETWKASTAYLSEVTDLARKRRLIASAKEQVGSGSHGRPSLRLMVDAACARRALAATASQSEDDDD